MTKKESSNFIVRICVCLMKLAIIVFVSFSGNIIAQEQTLTLNGKQRPILFSSKDGIFLSSLSAVGVFSAEIDSAEKKTEFQSARILAGARYNWLEIHTDLEAKRSQESGGFLNPDFLNQLFLQFDNVLNFPVQIRMGKFRTAAGMAMPYDYDMVLAKGYSLSEPFVGLYGAGAQVDIGISNKAGLVLDITGKSENSGIKPLYNKYKTEFSALLKIDVPHMYLFVYSGMQFSAAFVRYYARFYSYNPKGGLFFFDGAFFNEASNGENFWGYNATGGLRMGFFEWHIQLENGMLEYGKKVSLITNGMTFIFNRSDNEKYVLIGDFQTPIDDSRENWRVNVSFRVLFDF